MATGTELQIGDPREMFNANKDAMLQPSQEKAAVSLNGPEQQVRLGGLNNSFNVSAGFQPVWNAAELQQNGPDGGNVPFITPQTNLLHQIDMTEMTLSDQDMRGIKTSQSGIGELCSSVGNTMKQLGDELADQMGPAQVMAMNQQFHMKNPGLLGGL